MIAGRRKPVKAVGREPESVLSSVLLYLKSGSKSVSRILIEAKDDAEEEEKGGALSGGSLTSEGSPKGSFFAVLLALKRSIRSMGCSQNTQWMVQQSTFGSSRRGRRVPVGWVIAGAHGWSCCLI